MFVRARVFVSVGLLFLVSIFSVVASEKTITIQISPKSETIQKIRYQSGIVPSGLWESAPSFGMPIELEASVRETGFLFVQQATANGVWSKTYAYRYDKTERQWSIAEFPSKSAVHFCIRVADDSIEMIRYQYGNKPVGDWIPTDSSCSPLRIEKFDSDEDFLFVQQATADGTWSEIYAYRYDKRAKQWSSTAFPPKESITFCIKAVDDSIELFRYKYGNEPEDSWIPTDSSSSPLRIEEFDSGKEFLFVQQARKEEAWSDTYAYLYDYLSESWSLLPPIQDGKQSDAHYSFDVKAYALGPVGYCSNFYSYLLGGGIQTNISLGNLLGYSGITFSKGPPKSTWVKSQQALGISVGMGYSLALSERFALIPEIGYGVIFHMLEADFDKDGTYEFELFIDHQVRLGLYLTYAFNARQKFFIAPLGIIFFEKEQYGIMYGCQAGLRVSL